MQKLTIALDIPEDLAPNKLVMTEKVDFKKLFKKYYSPSIEPELIDLPTIQVLSLEGQGAPASENFQRAIQAMYGCFFTIKFGRKKAGLGPDYSGAPLEGLWWMKDQTKFDQARPADWLWKLLLWQPDFISQQDLDRARAELKKKKDNPDLGRVKLEKISEGAVVQIMHIGPYSAEAPTIKKLHEFAKNKGFELTGKHHEIYLGDPRRAKPEKLKTIIRQPVKAGAG